MSLISAVEASAVLTALETHLNQLEQQTKTPGLQGNMLSIAKLVYDKLQGLMKLETGIEPNLRDLTLNMVKGKFYSPFGIAADLEQWSAQSHSGTATRNYVWYDLCMGQK